MASKGPCFYGRQGKMDNHISSLQCLSKERGLLTIMAAKEPYSYGSQGKMNSHISLLWLSIEKGQLTMVGSKELQFYWK